MVIESRPGASGALAAHLVAKATPDGYTPLATSASMAINAALQTPLPYDTLRDFAGVSNIDRAIGVRDAACVMGSRLRRNDAEESNLCSSVQSVAKGFRG